ncbi:hypothetical protein BC834DRAFT_853395 [Gloeopeniophorella convolvens]|nr:hypothetical protein BC834DRAFT_853395 [Gloeopeniophorella convolvens]
MSDDHRDRWVGAMPLDQFFEEFVPEAPEKRPTNAIAFPGGSVAGKETPFIEAIHASGLCPDLQLENTTSKPSPSDPQKLKPDISVFSRSRLSPNKADLGLAEFWIENKRQDEDFFITEEKLKEKREAPISHIKSTEACRRTCGQLLSYASKIHVTQYRVFSFGVVLFGPNARILRCDRSGIIYTKLFAWNEANTLFEFLWRFNHLSDAQRGHDTTVCPATDDEAARALPKLLGYPGLDSNSLEPKNLLKILVRDDCPDNEPRCYIAPKATWITDTLVGRATFGFIAYDLTEGRLVYLKDFWRLDLPGMQKEGDVYRELEDADVSNIARMSRAGDVPLTPESLATPPGSLAISPKSLETPPDSSKAPSPVPVQRTITQDFVKADWCSGNPRVEPYVHYRLVLKTLGWPLNHFKSTWQLCRVIRDAIVAHSEAYQKTGILHRDISAGNILITRSGRGILIDWDLSKKVTTDDKGKPRRMSRTGTWQFISTGLLLDPLHKSHELSDDLESFFWVLLYQIFRFRTSGDVKDEHRDTLKEVFDQYKAQRDPNTRKFVTTGGAGKKDCLNGEMLADDEIALFVTTPCKEIIKDMRRLFSPVYLHLGKKLVSRPLQLSRESQRARDPLVQQALKKVQSSEALLAIMEKHLAHRWDVTDDGSLNLKLVQPSPTASYKRKRERSPVVDSEKSDVKKRRTGSEVPLESTPSESDVFSSPVSLPSQGNSSMLFSVPSGSQTQSNSQTSGTRSGGRKSSRGGKSKKSERSSKKP